jgi:parallel beta-helix repeat protein
MGLAALVTMLLMLASPAVAGTITVGHNDANYTTIQEAVDHAFAGDTILIRPGTYPEAVSVNKQLTLRGADASSPPIVDAAGNDTTFWISGNEVTLDRLSIRGGATNEVFLEADGASITNCTIRHEVEAEGKDRGRELDGHMAAVYGMDVKDVWIRGNDIDSRALFVICLYNPDDADVVDNTISADLPGYITSAVQFNYNRNGTVSGNRVHGNDIYHAGIYVERKTPNFGIRFPQTGLEITENTIDSGYHAIYLVGIENWGTNISYNTLKNGHCDAGIINIRSNSMTSTNAVVSHNTLENEEVISAIRLEGLVDSRVTDNTASDIKPPQAFKDAGIGLTILETSGTVVQRNIMTDCNVGFRYNAAGNTTPGMTIDETNLVDGRPIRFYEGRSRFTVDASTDGATYYFIDCHDFTVSGLTPSGCYEGIVLFASSNATVTGCTIERSCDGIVLALVEGAEISGNAISDCIDGIVEYRTTDTVVHDNDLSNHYIGVHIGKSLDNAVVEKNRFTNCNGGVFVEEAIESETMDIRENDFSANQFGTVLMYSNMIAVGNNTFRKNTGTAIDIEMGRENRITGNRIEENGLGVFINYRQKIDDPLIAGGNAITNNLFNNSEQVRLQYSPKKPDEESLSWETTDEALNLTELGWSAPPTSTGAALPEGDADPVNTWNQTKTAGVNIVDGPYLGGNYWAQPDGEGWSETHADRGDGFTAEPLVFDSNNTDGLPLHRLSGPHPYRPHVVPCRIEAEDYDLGGEGIGYHDRTPGNAGGQYRLDDVDIETGGSNFDVGWVKSSEWLEYTIEVDKAGLYTATFRTATPWNGRLILLSVDGNASGMVRVPRTGSFGTFASTTANLPLQAGTHHLRLRFVSDGQNLDYLDIAPVKEANFDAAPTSGKRSLKVTFTDTSTGTPVKWQWSFGDGKYSTSTVQNPTWYYNRAGTYSVTLKITYADGSTRTVTRPNLIRVR